ncbi:GGDEF domain-containing protein [Vibrio sp. T187]|uniref:GGDEF domain-containing protein n=1 Tax=Vibrio TaxID=662 RepID=UPI0010C95E4B|nr:MULTISPECIES: GGDEF domain-containing protein [Vibrio]MBW3694563.1 GGDEF domain-containing protein [Vibrio sp. T187]
MRQIVRLIWLAISVIACSAVFAASNKNESYIVATEADDIVTRVLFDSISKKFNVDIVYREFDSFDAILRSVELGQSDFAANVTHTKDREKRFDYSHPTNIEYTFLFSYSGAQLSQVDTVGVPKNTIYGGLIKALYPNITLVSYQGHEEAKALLESRKVDGVVDAINQLKPMLMSGLSSQLLNDTIAIKPVSIVAPKGKYARQLKEFTDYIHTEDIQRLLRESVSEYQYELRRDALRTTVVESGLNLDAPVTVKLEHNFPYVQYDADGKPYGLSAETVFEACELLTINCQLVSTENETWESMFHEFVVQNVDIIAPLVVSEPRKAIAYFTPPHFVSESILVKRVGYKDNVYKNISELIAERIGVVKDDFFDELLSQLLPNKKLVYFDSRQQLIAGLLNHEIDYFPIGTSGLSNTFQEKGLLPITQDYAIGSIHKSDIAIGIVKNERGAILAPLFERALQMIDTQRINNKYVQLPDWRETLEVEQRFAKRIQSILMLVLGFLVVVAMFLNTQSRTDSLTKLRNRRSLQHKYRRKIKPWHTVISLDMNHFKQINDTYGHEVGDLVLQRYASRISALWRGRSYRVGGDEFVLIGEVSEKALANIVEQLSQFTFVSEQHQLYLTITVSVGVSTDRKVERHLRDVLSNTDYAMYQSKKDMGRICTFVDESGNCTPSMTRMEVQECSQIA